MQLSGDVVGRSGRAIALARHTAQVVPIRGILACLGLSVAAVVAFSWSQASPTPVRAARLAAFLVAIALGYTQDDTAREITSSVSTSLGRRSLHRLTVAAPLCGAVWAIDVVLIGKLIGPVPVADLTTECLAFGAFALAANLLLAPHMPEQQGGIFVAPILLVSYFSAGLLYQPLLSSSPDEPGWAVAHEVLAYVAVLSGIGFALATWWPALRWRLRRA